MRCESCRSGDWQCNAWIDCEGPVVTLEERIDAVCAEVVRRGTFPVAGHGFDAAIRRADVLVGLVGALVERDGRACRRCGGEVEADIGLDEDSPFVEPRRVLACTACGVPA